MKIILFVIILPFCIFGQDEAIQKLFPGKWKMETPAGEVFEEWEVVSQTELQGMGYRLENDVKLVSKKIYLKKFADQWAFVALPELKNITLFALVEYSAEKFIFENKDHDFPQRIIYQFNYDNTLKASVEGIVNGQLRSKEFYYRLVEK